MGCLLAVPVPGTETRAPVALKIKKIIFTLNFGEAF
jgi:hypothetical protein